jgi:Cytochrome c7 and related cytochrome c/Class III cytochrome C family
MPRRARTRLFLILLATVTLAWGFVARSTPDQQAINLASSKASPVFTRGHGSLWDAIREFFDYRSAPQQPIAFTHKLHLAKGLECAGCHHGVEQGPDAGLPSVKLCMTCHLAIATDRPEIKKVAAYFERGEEIPWQRVYGYYPSAHVRFNHAPHIRAGVKCAACHGDMTQQTVAIQAVDLDMGYCLGCHRQKRASVDCTTCHF